jgi:Zn-dependent protease
MGGVVDRIVLWPLGGFTVFGIPNGAVFDELGISFSGPITHIFQGGLWAGIYSVIHNGDFSNFSAVILLEQFRYIDAVRFISILSSQAFFINLGIFFFNLFIPAYPLDGGRVLAALLVMGKFKLDTAARITAATGILIGLVLLFIGIFLYVIYTSAGALFVAVIAGFVISSGTRLWQAAASRRLHEHPLFHLDCYRNLSNNSRRSLTNSTNASRGLPISNSAHVV